VAYKQLAALRTKAFMMVVQSIRNGVDMPDDLEADMKYNIHQTYFNRQYEQLTKETASLNERIDAYLAEKAAAATPP